MSFALFSVLVIFLTRICVQYVCFHDILTCKNGENQQQKYERKKSSAQTTNEICYGLKELIRFLCVVVLCISLYKLYARYNGDFQIAQIIWFSFSMD